MNQSLWCCKTSPVLMLPNALWWDPCNSGLLVVYHFNDKSYVQYVFPSKIHCEKEQFVCFLSSEQLINVIKMMGRSFSPADFWYVIMFWETIKIIIKFLKNKTKQNNNIKALMSKIINTHQGSKLNILRYFWFASLSKSLTKADLFIINCACKIYFKKMNYDKKH